MKHKLKKVNPFRSSRHSKKITKLLFSVLAVLFIWTFFFITESFTKVTRPNYGSPPEFYANQNRQDLRATFVDAIAQATSHIYLLIYSLTDTAIIKTLNEKCHEGVDIHIICDPKTSPQLEKKLHKNIHLTRRISTGLMHQKILMVDDEYVWIGSANMTTESIRMHANLVLGMRHPDLASTIKTKAQAMEELISIPKMRHVNLLVGGQPFEIWFLPDEEKAAVGRIKKLIQSAEKTIRVAMFTFTRYDFADELIKAQKRGVDTRVVIDYHSGRGASNTIYEKLKKAGIPTTLSNSTGLLHHKFAYIDGKTLINGSANWTKAAFTQNDDCFVVLQDLNLSQQEQLDGLWEIIETEAK